MSKRGKRLLKTIIVLVLIALIGFMVYTKFFAGKHQAKKIEVVDEIKEYGYKLDENETKLYKDLFVKLKTELEKENPNEEEYAKLVSQLFIADFYNLDNKTSKNDIGGTQFLQPEMVQNFELKATDTMYHTVEADLNGKRKQSLPEVTALEVTDVEQEQFSSDVVTDPQSYKVTVKLTYKEDLGYQEEVTITLAHVDKKLNIVAVN